MVDHHSQSARCPGKPPESALARVAKFAADFKGGKGRVRAAARIDAWHGAARLAREAAML